MNKLDLLSLLLVFGALLGFPPAFAALLARIAARKASHRPPEGRPLARPNRDSWL